MVCSDGAKWSVWSQGSVLHAPHPTKVRCVGAEGLEGAKISKKDVCAGGCGVVQKRGAKFVSELMIFALGRGEFSKYFGCECGVRRGEPNFPFGVWGVGCG